MPHDDLVLLCTSFVLRNQICDAYINARPSVPPLLLFLQLSFLELSTEIEHFVHDTEMQLNIFSSETGFCNTSNTIEEFFAFFYGNCYTAPAIFDYLRHALLLASFTSQRFQTIHIFSIKIENFKMLFS